MTARCRSLLLETGVQARCVAGGYFLANSLPRPRYLSTRLPDHLLSASPCIVEMLPDLLGIPPWSSRGKEKWETELGLDHRRLPEVALWVEERIAAQEIAWGSVFFSTQIARDFLKLLGLSGNQMGLLGIALPERHVASFQQDSVRPDYPILPGVNLMLRRGRPLDSGAKLLGYEVLGWELPDFHTWLCYDFEKDAYEKLGLSPNCDGFIDTLDNAEKLAEYATLREPKAGEVHLWLPWLVASYALEA